MRAFRKPTSSRAAAVSHFHSRASLLIYLLLPILILSLMLGLALMVGYGQGKGKGASNAQSAEAVKGKAASEKYPENASGYVEFVEEYKTPGIETELSGIYPHPTDDNLYYVITNGKPTYKPTMKPLLPVALRNKLLTVNRAGEVVKVLDLPDGGGLFGDIDFGDGHLWLGPLEPPALWKLNPESGKVVARYTLPGPAGGMEFDRDRGVIYVQNYIGHPHLVVIDAKTGVVIKSLWSDENAMGMAKVDGDLLTVYTNGWAEDAYSELWVLDPETGKPKSRLRLSGVHAAMAPLDKKVSGYEGFMTMIHKGSAVTGETAIRRYRYVGEKNRAAAQVLAPRQEAFAAIQFSPAQTTPSRNLDRLSELIQQAAADGARYAVLPEWATVGSLPLKGERGGLAQAEPIPGPTTARLAELAVKHGIWIAFSLPEVNESGDGFYVTAVLIDERGRVAAKNQKRVLRYNGEDGAATPGFARILMDTIDNKGHRFGLLSGDDLASGVPRLADRGADTILVCANWSKTDPVNWNEQAAQLAKQYQVNLVIANRQPSYGGIFARAANPLQAKETEPNKALIATLESSTGEWAIPSSLGLPSVPVPSHQPITPGLVELGRALFFDPKLSNSGTVSCATCHIPEKFFANGEVAGVGVYGRQTTRNVPSLLNTAFKNTLHWDGTPTTLEQQVKYPLTGYAEMDLSSYDKLIKYLKSVPAYAEGFRQELKIEPEEVTREDLARALASYQRTLVSGASPFDLYYYGKDKTALSAEARQGFELFTGKAACVSCHRIDADYALFTDGKFHRLGVGYVPEKNLYVDPGVGMVSKSDYDGMFFTPSLRNVAETAPYMHDGSIKTLEEAVTFHYRQSDARINLDPAFKRVQLSATELQQLISFLRSLTGKERYTARGELLDARTGNATHHVSRRPLYVTRNAN
jgi:cytochrome c peroxidase